jgi:hypothetical protein
MRANPKHRLNIIARLLLMVKQQGRIVADFCDDLVRKKLEIYL